MVVRRCTVFLAYIKPNKNPFKKKCCFSKSSKLCFQLHQLSFGFLHLLLGLDPQSMLTGRWKSFKIVEKLRTVIFHQTPAAAFVEFLLSNKREQVEFRQTSRVNDSNKETNNGFFHPKRHSAVNEVAIIAPGEVGGGVRLKWHR